MSKRFVRLGTVLATLFVTASPALASVTVSPKLTANTIPPAVYAATIALRDACANWPKETRFALPAGSPASPTAGPTRQVLHAVTLCDVSEGRASGTDTIAFFASVLTLVSLIPIAIVLALVRMIIIAGWSWRPRRLGLPYAR